MKNASTVESTGSFSLRRTLVFSIRSAEALLDRHAKIALFLLACLLSIWTLAESSSKPLVYDEQVALAAANAPHLGDIIAALAIPIEFNPPLFYVLARLSIKLLGYSAMAARLPSFLSMLVFLLCLFAFISRHRKASYGVLGVFLVLCTPVSQYAWDARPYALLLGFTGIALVSYQSRTHHKGVLALLAVILSFACLPVTHYYGVLIVGSFVLSEIISSVSRKQIDWALLIGMLFAPLVALFPFRHLIASQMAGLKHFHSQGTLGSFIGGYDLFRIPAYVFYLSILAIAIFVILQTSVKDETFEEDSLPEFSESELTLAVFLLLLPLLGAVVSRFITHAYIPRYFVAACAGYAILICYLLSLIRRSAGLALLLSVVTAASVFFQMFEAVKYRHQSPPMAGLVAMAGKTHHPVVFEDAKDYVVARELNPAMGEQFYYVAEPDIAIKLIGSDTDDRTMRGLATLQPVQVRRLNDLAQISDEWVVVPGSYGWLTRCLERMGAARQLVNAKDPSTASGLPAFTTQFPHSGSMSAPWCEAQQ